jgi:hypothetical protein
MLLLCQAGAWRSREGALVNKVDWQTQRMSCRAVGTKADSDGR